MAAGDLRTLLAAPRFRRLFGVRLVAQTADGLLQASLATFVLFSPERQATAAKVAVAFAVLLLPYSLVGPFVGVLLDRWRRRQVLVVANVLRAGSVAVIAALVAAERDGPDLALAVLVSLGVGRFVLAALSAGLPHVVEGPRLVTANALTPTAGTIASAGGALAGVALRAAAGGGDRGSLVVLGVAGLGYLLAAATAALLPADALGPTGRRPGQSVRAVVVGLADGVRHLRARPEAARAMAVVVAHRAGFGALTVAALLLVRNTFNPPADPDAGLRMFAAVTAGAAGGALVGAVLTPALTRRLGAVRWSCAALLLAGGLGLGALLAGTPAGLVTAAVVVGLAGQAVKVCGDTAVQARVADDHLGRVFALYDMVLNVGLVAGITAVAFTAPESGRSVPGFVAVGALFVGTALWYAAASPTPRPARGTA